MRRLIILSFFLMCGSILYAQSKDVSKKIEFHFNKCKEYLYKNNEKRMWHAKKALFLSEKYNLKEERAKALGELGSSFHEQSQHDSARYYLNKSYRQFQALNDNLNCAVVLMNKSWLEETDGNLIKSFQLLMSADSIFKAENHPNRRIETHVSLASILLKQKEFEKALRYLKRADQMDSVSPQIKIIIYHNMVGCYGQLGDFDNSYIYSLKSIKIAEALNNPNALSDCYNNLAAIILREKGANPEVIELLNKALAGYKSVGNDLGVIRCHTSLGTAYRLNKKYSFARQHLLLAEKGAMKIDDNSLILSSNRELSKFYVELKNWEKAYVYYTTFKEMEDSLNSLEKTKIIQDLQTKYETKELKRENELVRINGELSEEKAAKSRNLSILIFAAFTFFLLIIFLVYIQYRQRKKKEVLELKLKATEKRLSLEKQTRRSELKALQAQMNPHFVFNSLNSIQDLILQNDRRHSIDYLGKFSELTRKILQQSNNEYITVSNEIEIINLYADFEKLRFGDELEFKVVNEIDAIKSDELLIPSMFIQPYIENAYKHGLIHKENEKKLVVTFKEEDEHLLCIIDDNGIGRERSNEINRRREKLHLNVSTKTNAKRIDLLNHNTEHKIKLEVIDKMNDDIPSGTTVKIYFEMSAKSKMKQN